MASQLKLKFVICVAVSEKNLTPEQFSEILVDDLEIPGAFVPAIANFIRTQVCALFYLYSNSSGCKSDLH